MNKAIAILLALIAFPLFAQTDSQWVLKQSTLTYHVSHPLHQVEGVSHEAKGKGVCHGGQCDFLIAVPVKSFDSKDSNRDLHMASSDAWRRISDNHCPHASSGSRIRISNDSCRSGGSIRRANR